MHYSCRLLYFAALVLFSVPAFSAVTVEAVRVGSAYTGPSNQTLFDATLKTTSTTPGVPAKYVSRPIAVSAASAARLARGALGGPLGLAVTAAMLAEGLLIDNDTGEIVEEDIVYPPSEYSSVWRVDGGAQGLKYGIDPISACQGMTSSGFGSCSGHYVTNMTSSSGSCRAQCTRPPPNGPTEYNWALSRVTNTGQADRPGLPASDAQIADAVPDSTLRDLINDLIQRRPSSIPTVLPELASEMDATRDAQEAAESHSADPGTNPAPTPEQQEIVDNQTTTEPSFAAEWPNFCSWAAIVCEFIDWMRAEPELPENPPIPLLDIDIPDYDSNLPSTVECPAPVVVTTQMWGSFELSYQPFCDLADYIRYGVLGIAYLFAAYIIIGVRR